MSTFTLATAQAYLNSTDEFPIDFNEAWVWLGYTTKGNAKRALISKLIDGFDYFIISDKLGSIDVPRPNEEIKLSIEGLKRFAMMANTDQGREVRDYFLQCERIAKSKHLPQTHIEALEAYVESLKQVQALKLQAEADAPTLAIGELTIKKMALATLQEVMLELTNLAGCHSNLLLKNLKLIGKREMRILTEFANDDYFEHTIDIRHKKVILVTDAGIVWLKTFLSENQATVDQYKLQLTPEGRKEMAKLKAKEARARRKQVALDECHWNN